MKLSSRPRSIRIGEAFCPGHISGIFEVVEHQGKLLGSRGAGLTLELGARSKVKLSDSDRILINNAPDPAITTNRLIRNLREFLEIPPLDIRIQLQLPVGCGFGMSAAGTFATALALDSLLSMGLGPEGCAYQAFQAEIDCLTGLGDVVAQLHGGLVLRNQPGFQEVSAFPVDARVHWVVFGEIPTPEILSDPQLRSKISSVAQRCLAKFRSNPSLENFFRCAREFCLKSELATEKVIDALEAIDSAGGLGSMIMLGEAVFGIGPGLDEVLSEFGNTGSCMIGGFAQARGSRPQRSASRSWQPQL